MAERHHVYLHGFASSPASTKARVLGDRLGRYGLTLHCPDLNRPDFSTLTVTRMIGQTADLVRALPEAPVVLYGSSLGGFVALHLAERAASLRLRVDRLVLLAPALDFGSSRTRIGDGGIERWRATGWTSVMHHADGETRRVHYALLTDARTYDSFAARAPVPTLILQGRDDEVVDPVMVERFAADRPHVRLVMLDDGHQLGASLDRLWTEIAAFLDLPPEG